MSFAMVVRELVNSPNPDISMLNPEMISSLEDEGWKMFKDNFVVESIKLFTLTGNVNRLVQIGESCLKNGHLVWAFHALRSTKNLELLTELGMRFISDNDKEMAKKCFVAAGNEEMLVFLDRNF